MQIGGLSNALISKYLGAPPTLFLLPGTHSVLRDFKAEKYEITPTENDAG